MECAGWGAGEDSDLTCGNKAQKDGRHKDDPEVHIASHSLDLGALAGIGAILPPQGQLHPALDFARGRRCSKNLITSGPSVLREGRVRWLSLRFSFATDKRLRGIETQRPCLSNEIAAPTAHYPLKQIEAQSLLRSCLE